MSCGSCSGPRWAQACCSQSRRSGRRDIDAHRAWMIRAYAIGLAAGTQTFTEGIAGAIVGTGELRMDLAKGAGWVINLAVAEWVIRRPARQRDRRHPRSATTTHSAPVGALT